MTAGLKTLGNAANLIGLTEAARRGATVERAELVRRARDGDRDAYDILVTESIDAMYRVARLILRRKPAASSAPCTSPA